MLRVFVTSDPMTASWLVLFPKASRKYLSVQKVLLALLSVTAPNLCSAVDEDGANTVQGHGAADALVFDGDLSYRYESIDSGDVSFDRQRVRARLGVQAEVNPATRAVFRFF